MSLPITIFLIYDMSAYLSANNIKIINEQNGTDYPELEDTVSYQMLYDSREEIGSQRGYFRKKNNGLENIWVLPDLFYSQDTSELNPNTGVQVTEEEYINIYEPSFDPLPEID